jgi:hypothetical protein
MLFILAHSAMQIVFGLGVWAGKLCGRLCTDGSHSRHTHRNGYHAKSGGLNGFYLSTLLPGSY